MSSPLRVLVDLLGDAASPRLAGLVRSKGGEVIAPGEGVPQVAILVPRAFKRMQDSLPPTALKPTVMLWTSSPELPLRSLLRHRIFDLLDPDSGDEELSRALGAAMEEHRRRLVEQQAKEGMERRYRDLSTIIRFSLETGSQMKLEQVLERIVQQLHQELGYGIVSIMLKDAGGECLTIQASRGLDDKVVKNTRVRIGSGIAGWVARHGKPLLVRDVEQDPRFGRSSSHPRYSSKSLVCVPLKAADRVVGVLNGNNRGDGPLTVHDLRLLSVLASQATVSLERARLYQAMEASSAELRRAYDRLQEMDRMKSDFMVNVSHELRTPITILMGYLEILRGRLDPSSDQREMVEIALSEAHRLTAVVEDVTDVLRLDAGEVSFDFSPVQVESFLRSAAEEYRGKAEEVGVEFRLRLEEGLPELSLDMAKMGKVLDKLLDNSLKFTPRGGYLLLSAGCGDGRVTVTVEDSGPGVPVGDRERIFEQFGQGGDILTEKPKGAGLGLPIARAIVRRHGGRLWLDESFEEGCRISFELPVESPGERG